MKRDLGNTGIPGRLATGQHSRIPTAASSGGASGGASGAVPSSPTRHGDTNCTEQLNSTLPVARTVDDLTGWPCDGLGEMRAHLRCGDAVHALDGTVTAIGRGDACHVVLRSRSVEPQHASIEYLERDGVGAYVLRDLNTTNGTFVNELRVQRDTVITLKHGDTIRFGYDSATYRFEETLESSRPSSSMADRNADARRRGVPSQQPPNVRQDDHPAVASILPPIPHTAGEATPGGTDAIRVLEQRLRQLEAAAQRAQDAPGDVQADAWGVRDSFGGARSPANASRPQSAKRASHGRQRRQWSKAGPAGSVDDPISIADVYGSAAVGAVEALEAELEARVEELRDRDGRIASLSAELRRREHAVITLQQRERSMEEQLGECRSEMVERENLIAALREDIARFRTAAGGAAPDVALAELRKDLEGLSGDRDALRGRVESIEAAKAAMEAELISRAERAEGELASTLRSIAQLADVDGAESPVVAVHLAFERLTTQLKDMSRRLEDEHARATESARAVEELRAERDAQANQLSDARQSLDKAARDLEAAVSRLEVERDDARKKYDGFCRDLANVFGVQLNTSAAEAGEALTRAAGSLVSTLKGQKAALDGLARERDEQTSLRSQAVAEAKSLKDTITELQQKVRKLEVAEHEAVQRAETVAALEKDIDYMSEESRREKERMSAELREATEAARAKAAADAVELEGLRLRLVAAEEGLAVRPQFVELKQKYDALCLELAAALQLPQPAQPEGTPLADADADALAVTVVARVDHVMREQFRLDEIVQEVNADLARREEDVRNLETEVAALRRQVQDASAGAQAECEDLRKRLEAKTSAATELEEQLDTALDASRELERQRDASVEFGIRIGTLVGIAVADTPPEEFRDKVVEGINVLVDERLLMREKLRETEAKLAALAGPADGADGHTLAQKQHMITQLRKELDRKSARVGKLEADIKASLGTRDQLVASLTKTHADFCRALGSLLDVDSRVSGASPTTSIVTVEERILKRVHRLVRTERKSTDSADEGGDEPAGSVSAATSGGVLPSVERMLAELRGGHAIKDAEIEHLSELVDVLSQQLSSARAGRPAAPPKRRARPQSAPLSRKPAGKPRKRTGSRGGSDADEGLQDAVAERDATIEELMRELKAAKARLTDVRADLSDEQKARIVELERTVAQHAEETARLREERQRANTEHQQQVEDLERRLRAALEGTQELSGKVEKASKKLTEFRKTILRLVGLELEPNADDARIFGKVEKFARERVQLKQDREALKRERETLQGHVTELKDQIKLASFEATAQHEREKQRLESDLRRARQAAARLQKQAASSEEAALAKPPPSSDELQKKIAELGTVQAKSEARRQKIIQLKSALRTLQEDYAVKDEMLLEARTRADELERAVVRLKVYETKYVKFCKKIGRLIDSNIAVSTASPSSSRPSSASGATGDAIVEKLMRVIREGREASAAASAGTAPAGASPARPSSSHGRIRTGPTGLRPVTPGGEPQADVADLALSGRAVGGVRFDEDRRKEVTFADAPHEHDDM